MLSDKLKQFFPLADASVLSSGSLTAAYGKGGKDGLLNHALEQAAAATEKKVGHTVLALFGVLFVVGKVGILSGFTQQGAVQHLVRRSSKCFGFIDGLAGLVLPLLGLRGRKECRPARKSEESTSPKGDHYLKVVGWRQVGTNQYHRKPTLGLPKHIRTP